MFGRRRTKPDQQAADSAKADDKTTTDSELERTGTSKGDSSEQNPDHEESPGDTPDEQKAEKPKRSSWWSALGNINYLSLLSTAQDTMANMDSKELDKRKAQMMDATKDLPADKAQMMQALAAQQNATGLLQKASKLKDQAMKAMNPQERQRMLQEAYDKEVQANGQSKTARRMQSGAWQGGVGGAGIGGGVGAGLGTVVGTLVGGVVALPTTALGGLVGAGVGSITGPFVKLNQAKAKEVEAREKAKGKSDEEVAEAINAEAIEEVAAEDVPEDGITAPGTPSAAAISQPRTGSAKQNLQRQQSGVSISKPEAGSAKKNLQRQQSSGATAVNSKPARDPNAPKKKPRKLEVRSTKTKPEGEE